ncbi:MAG: hypothetical protein V8R67_08640 [Eubacterium sp.]
MIGDKMNQIIQAAVHAFAQADIVHRRLPNYEDYFACARLAIYIYNVSKMIKGKAAAG